MSAERSVRCLRGREGLTRQSESAAAGPPPTGRRSGDTRPPGRGVRGPHLGFGDDVRGELDHREVALADSPLDFVVAHPGSGGPAAAAAGRRAGPGPGVGHAGGGRAATAATTAWVADPGTGGGGLLGPVAVGGQGCVCRPGRVCDPGRSAGTSGASARHGRHFLASLREQQAAAWRSSQRSTAEQRWVVHNEPVHKNRLFRVNQQSRLPG